MPAVYVREVELVSVREVELVSAKGADIVAVIIAIIIAITIAVGIRRPVAVSNFGFSGVANGPTVVCVRPYESYCGAQPLSSQCAACVQSRLCLEHCHC